MNNKIDSMHEIYFYIQNNDNIQFCNEIYNHIKKVSKKEKEISSYEIYYKE